MLKNKISWRHILFALLFSISWSANAQENKITFGINLAETPLLAIDICYNYTITPYFELSANTGYGFNHVYGADLNFILISHIKCDNNGLIIKNQSGGFIKTGLRLNARTSYEKHHYFFMEFNIINSVVYEKVDFSNYVMESLLPLDEEEIRKHPVQQHTLYVFGPGIQFGYSFKMGKYRGDAGLQVAFPNKNYQHLFGYENYIPGMGYTDSYDYWFPKFIFNFKL